MPQKLAHIKVLIVVYIVYIYPPHIFSYINEIWGVFQIRKNKWNSLVKSDFEKIVCWVQIQLIGIE